MPDILPPDNNPPCNAHARSVAVLPGTLSVSLYRMALEPPDEPEKPPGATITADEYIKAACPVKPNDHPLPLDKEATNEDVASYEPLAETEDKKDDKDTSLGNASHDPLLAIDDGPPWPDREPTEVV